MGKKDKTGSISGTLANALYTLGLIQANDGQFLRLLNSREMEEFEEWLKDQKAFIKEDV